MKIDQWSVGDIDHDSDECHCATWLPILAGGTPIARVGFEDSRWGVRFADEGADDRAQHARLIAAAPDLLAACRSAKAWLEYCSMDDTVQWNRLAEAIARAEGKPARGQSDAIN